VLVCLHHRVDFFVSHCRQALCDLGDPIAVHLPAELNLGRHLVSLGDCHLAHVVAQACHPHRLAIRKGCSSLHPRGDMCKNLGILPVADNDLSRSPKSCVDKSVLPIPVRRLIQVHKIHIDGIPGDIAVELCVQVQKGLLIFQKTTNPHLGGRKRVHPSDDPRTFRIGVGFSEQRNDIFGGCRDTGLNHGGRYRIGLVEKSVMILACVVTCSSASGP